MSRRRPKGRPPSPVKTQQTVEWQGEVWVVSPIRGSSSAKDYRCPGCDQEIPPATPHVVVWPQETIAGESIDARRHWHTPCWNARERRGRR